jgi:hypothetical protein
VPSHIDIYFIASHAQAEALVQQDILEMEGMQDDSLSSDTPPVNAKLAAHGESLVLER